MEDLQPEISIIIPIHHSSQLIADTCESILSQQNVTFEAIFIDAGEELQADELVKSYHDSRIKVQALTKASLYALMNRGLLLARGKYVNLLLEGCTYLSPHSLAEALSKIRQKGEPDVYYSAAYVGESLYYLNDWKSALKKGFQPTLLQCCFFKTSLFKTSGYFRQDLDRRGALDFFCRLEQNKAASIASDERVYVEMNKLPKALLSKGRIFSETLRILYERYGLMTAARWLFSRQLKALLRRRYPLDLLIAQNETATKAGFRGS